MEFLEYYRQKIISSLQNYFYNYEPIARNLYLPVDYALEGGKKLRPIAVLLTAEAFGESSDRALPGAVAIEMFHNFTLVHDDIMDNSPIRRGRPTVYRKWDLNQALLSGDAMLILVYHILDRLPERYFRRAVKLMTWAGLRVSEGQQLDMEFEKERRITLEQYMQMIELKTAVLLGVAFRMGAMLADVAEYEQQKIYDFGKYLGLAFQIQDDYMDIYSDEKVFGKQHGSDIKSNKKTYLLLKALELSDRQTAQTLIEYFNAQLQPEEKVRLITEIYQSLGLKQKVEADIVAMYSKAKDVLSSIQGLTGEGRERLSSLADYLIRRQR